MAIADVSLCVVSLDDDKTFENLEGEKNNDNHKFSTISVPSDLIIGLNKALLNIFFRLVEVNKWRRSKYK